MDGVTLLRDAQAAGLSVSADDGRLVIRGPTRCEALAKRLLAYKADVLAAIAQDDIDLLFPPEVMAGLRAATVRLLGLVKLQAGLEAVAELLMMQRTRRALHAISGEGAT